MIWPKVILQSSYKVTLHDICRLQRHQAIRYKIVFFDKTSVKQSSVLKCNMLMIILYEMTSDVRSFIKCISRLARSGGSLYLVQGAFVAVKNLQLFHSTWKALTRQTYKLWWFYAIEFVISLCGLCLYLPGIWPTEIHL